MGEDGPPSDRRVVHVVVRSSLVLSWKWPCRPRWPRIWTSASAVGEDTRVPFADVLVLVKREVGGLSLGKDLTGASSSMGGEGQFFIPEMFLSFEIGARELLAQLRDLLGEQCFVQFTLVQLAFGVQQLRFVLIQRRESVLSFSFENERLPSVCSIRLRGVELGRSCLLRDERVWRTCVVVAVQWSTISSRSAVAGLCLVWSRVRFPANVDPTAIEQSARTSIISKERMNGHEQPLTSSTNGSCFSRKESFGSASSLSFLEKERNGHVGEKEESLQLDGFSMFQCCAPLQFLFQSAVFGGQALQFLIVMIVESNTFVRRRTARRRRFGLVVARRAVISKLKGESRVRRGHLDTHRV